MIKHKITEDVEKEYQPSSTRLDDLAKTWRKLGARPKQIEPVGPGEESVWAYPRPPAIAIVHHNFEVSYDGCDILRAKNAVKVMETASPPSYYFELESLVCDISISEKLSYCEWKGTANYLNLNLGKHIFRDVAWYYRNPYEEYHLLQGLVSIYPSKFDIFIDDDKVEAQAGDYYGGWITSAIKGPFKGNFGTGSW